MDSHFQHLIRAARLQGFTINLDNFEIEIYRPNATISAAFNPNDPAQVREASEYIRSYWKEQAREEQEAIKRVRAIPTPKRQYEDW